MAYMYVRFVVCVVMSHEPCAVSCPGLPAVYRARELWALCADINSTVQIGSTTIVVFHRCVMKTYELTCSQSAAARNLRYE